MWEQRSPKCHQPFYQLISLPWFGAIKANFSCLFFINGPEMVLGAEKKLQFTFEFLILISLYLKKTLNLAGTPITQLFGAVLQLAACGLNQGNLFSSASELLNSGIQLVSVFSLSIYTFDWVAKLGVSDSERVSFYQKTCIRSNSPNLVDGTENLSTMVDFFKNVTIEYINPLNQQRKMMFMMLISESHQPCSKYF